MVSVNAQGIIFVTSEEKELVFIWKILKLRSKV